MHQRCRHRRSTRSRAGVGARGAIEPWCTNHHIVEAIQVHIARAADPGAKAGARLIDAQKRRGGEAGTEVDKCSTVIGDPIAIKAIGANDEIVDAIVVDIARVGDAGSKLGAALPTGAHDVSGALQERVDSDRIACVGIVDTNHDAMGVGEDHLCRQ